MRMSTEEGRREERWAVVSMLRREKRWSEAPKYLLATETMEAEGSIAVMCGVKKERVVGREHPPAPMM